MRILRRLRRSERGLTMYGREKGGFRKKEEYAGIFSIGGKGNNRTGRDG